jgi:hypothetical protein
MDYVKFADGLHTTHIKNMAAALSVVAKLKV